jgi:hypothetical protein
MIFKITTRFRMLSFGFITSVGALGLVNADDIVTVNGITYDVTTTSGTYNTLQGTLQSQPWWGNLPLANSVATAVGNNLGQTNNGSLTPFFATSA